MLLIARAPSARVIGSAGAFEEDTEVLFRPGITFRVARWYRGSVIALGQRNIRDTTFAMSEADVASASRFLEDHAREGLGSDQRLALSNRGIGLANIIVPTD